MIIFISALFFICPLKTIFRQWSEIRITYLLINVLIYLYVYLCIYQLGHVSACVCRGVAARGKFGEHERGVRVQSKSSLLSAHQTSQVLNILTYAQLKHELVVL